MDIPALVKQLTLEEKAGLCSGTDFWHTKAVERLGIPAVMMSDGPHGLRKQEERGDHVGVNDSIPAVCFPAACATAASFDRALLTRMGEALGDACRHEGVAVLLGPAVNIKRSPLCGRNFEYFSEDPYLTGELAAAFIHGVQSRNVGTSIKHFAANSQEHRRMSSSAEVEERALREIYLPGFETPVKREQPWTVMCSYNRLNGTYASEHPWLLTELLRDEWGFEGAVVSDWGAVNDRVEGVKAGLDLEMPSSHGYNDRLLVEAVRAGKLDEAVLDRAAERVLRTVYRYTENARPETPWDMETQHELAARIAEECMVLLKNDGGLLPLSKDTPVAFIGEFAEKPRFQGGGSSHINSFKISSALEAAAGLPVFYARGYDAAHDCMSGQQLGEALAAARAASVAVVFAGLPDRYESEGYDRSHMRLPDCQNRLIEAVAAVNPNTVVLLHNGAPVEMPWLENVRAVMECYLGGQAVGLAQVRLLYGDADPCGRLPESFPKRLEDNPSYLSYGGEGNTAVYREGIFVGYRYYDRKKTELLFPFGYGLSYTDFSCADLRLSADSIADSESLTATVTVTNTGKRPGKAVVQLYVRDVESSVFRPERELKGFEKLLLQPGESKELSFRLDKRSFAFWSEERHDWLAETGEYRVEIGFSSREILLSAPVTVRDTGVFKRRYDRSSIFLDLLADPRAAGPLRQLLTQSQRAIGDDGGSDAAREAVNEEMSLAMMQYMPLRSLVSFAGEDYDVSQIDRLLEELNK